MRKFLQNQNQTQKAEAVSSEQSGKVMSRSTVNTHPILQLQDAIGNQALLRLLKSRQQGSEGDNQRLDELWAAVKTTTIGKQFLALVKNKEPKLRWGNTGNARGHFDGNKTITLNKSMKDKLSDNEWKQVIAMELGNFAHKAQFDDIDARASDGKLSKDQYVSEMVKVEFDTRNLVNEAYKSGEFCALSPDCPPIFDLEPISFDKYIKDERGAKDRAKYEADWEEYYKDAYVEEHPEGK